MGSRRIRSYPVSLEIVGGIRCDVPSTVADPLFADFSGHIVPFISIRRLFLGNLFFLRNNPRIFDFFDGFRFKTVKIIFFLPKNPVLGTVPQKKIVFISWSITPR